MSLLLHIPLSNAVVWVGATLIYLKWMTSLDGATLIYLKWMTSLDGGNTDLLDAYFICHEALALPPPHTHACTL